MSGHTHNGTEDAGRDTIGWVPVHPPRPAAPSNTRPAEDAGRDAAAGHPARDTPTTDGTVDGTLSRDPATQPAGRDTGRWGRLTGRLRRGTRDTPSRGEPVPSRVPQPPVPPAVPSRKVKRTRDTDRPSPRPRRTPRRRDSTVSARESFGRLTYSQSRAGKFGMIILAVLIAVSLIAVVIAPPTLSAQDILDWARLDSPDAGLGLDGNWPWVVFLALDFSAAVCVLVSLFCAFRNEPAGWFGVGVWMFAAMTAYANYSFNNVPGAPGDGIWFFPLMSIVGPVMLHWMTKKIRGWVLESAGGRRGARPKFEIADWFPLTGSPQATFGAWRVGGMLGISVPDDALFAYRALTRGRGWWRRWLVNGVVRDAVYDALDARLEAGEMHPRLLTLLVPATDGVDGPGPEDTDRPASRDPLDEIENDLVGDPLGTPRSRGTGRPPVSGPPSPSRPTVPRDSRHGTPVEDTSATGHRGTPPSREDASDDGTARDGTRDGTVEDAPYDEDLIRYADHILAITEEFPGWRKEIPGLRPATRAIDAHWRKIGRASQPGGEPGFNSRSTTRTVLDALNRLAVQPGITEQIENLRERDTSTTD